VINHFPRVGLLRRLCARSPACNEGPYCRTRILGRVGYGPKIAEHKTERAQFQHLTQVDKMTDIKVLIVMAAALLVCSQRVIAKSPTNILHVKGQVSTADAIPIANVVVRIWRSGKVHDSATSDDAGRFLLCLGDGATIDAVTFDPPDTRFYGPAVVENLSGMHDQQINIVLFNPQYFKLILRRATNSLHVSLSPIQGQVSAINRIVEIESGVPIDRQSDPSRYCQFVHRMRFDEALFGRDEAAQMDGYLEAFETKLARVSALKAGKADQARE
jgi:hypothetical protein